MNATVPAKQLFQPLKPQTIEDDILRSVRNAIISGRIGLGEHLNETKTAEEMGVSRIPVREALKKLEQEGLVVRYANRGCFVVDFDDDDVREVFSLRATLESMAFEWLTPRLTAVDFRALHELVSAQEQAVRLGDFDELARLDIRFHEYLVMRAEHTRLLKSWREIYRQCQVLLNMRFRFMADFTPDTVPVDHLLILQALEGQEAAAAIALTCEISERVQNECIETLHNYRARTS